jgi:hypothetical protein
MSKSELDVEENKSGGSKAGEGAFPPTPAEPAQIKKVWIDLSDIRIPIKTGANAAEILKDILRNYKVRILVLLNFSDTFEILRDYRGVAKKIFAEEENDEVAIQKTAEKLAELRYIVTFTGITVVMLYTGKETAVAFVEPRE